MLGETGILFSFLIVVVLVLVVVFGFDFDDEFEDDDEHDVRGYQGLPWLARYVDRNENFVLVLVATVSSFC